MLTATTFCLLFCVHIRTNKVQGCSRSRSDNIQSLKSVYVVRFSSVSYCWILVPVAGCGLQLVKWLHRAQSLPSLDIFKVRFVFVCCELKTGYSPTTEMAMRKFASVLQILQTKSPYQHLTRGYYLYSPEPIHPLPDRKPDWKTADEAVQVVQSGETFVFHWYCRSEWILLSIWRR